MPSFSIRPTGFTGPVAPAIRTASRAVAIICINFPFYTIRACRLPFSARRVTSSPAGRASRSRTAFPLWSTTAYPRANTF